MIYECERRKNLKGKMCALKMEVEIKITNIFLVVTRGKTLGRNSLMSGDAEWED